MKIEKIRLGCNGCHVPEDERNDKNPVCKLINCTNYNYNRHSLNTDWTFEFNNDDLKSSWFQITEEMSKQLVEDIDKEILKSFTKGGK